MKFGLIGYPLTHSFSQRYFKEKFQQEAFEHYDYQNFEIENIRLFPKIIRGNSDLIGLNVTIPYKRQIIRYIDSLDRIAERIQSVNTLVINRRGVSPVIFGYNTDVIGFKKALLNWPLDEIKEALVFGSGGSSAAVRFVLNDLGIKVNQVSRQPGSGTFTYQEIHAETLVNSKLWINCTPVGMYPNLQEELPLDYHLLTDSHFLFDLIYNPEISRFIQHGLDRGAKTQNGYQMLVLQAEASWRIWSNYIKKFPSDPVL